MVFVFGSAYVMDYIYRFAYVEPGLRPKDETNVVVMDNLFDERWIWFPIILLRIFISIFIMDIGLKFFCVSARFWYQDDVGLIK